jgi:NAD(P)-dependent dehydrogenase (short-subunit alcohol dehydrogenase family)
MPDTEVVVITGASAGVGRATAREFAKRGAAIGLLARGEPALEAARIEVEELGGRALVLPADVSNHAEVDQAALEVERKLGPITIWINNAMVSVFSPVRETEADEFRRVTEVTYLGVVHGTMAALRHMAPRGRGTIVQVGSALTAGLMQNRNRGVGSGGRQSIAGCWPGLEFSQAWRSLPEQNERVTSTTPNPRAPSLFLIRLLFHLRGALPRRFCSRVNRLLRPLLNRASRLLDRLFCVVAGFLNVRFCPVLRPPNAGAANHQTEA